MVRWPWAKSANICVAYLNFAKVVSDSFLRKDRMTSQSHPIQQNKSELGSGKEPDMSWPNRLDHLNEAIFRQFKQSSSYHPTYAPSVSPQDMGAWIMNLGRFGFDVERLSNLVELIGTKISEFLATKSVGQLWDTWANMDSLDGGELYNNPRHSTSRVVLENKIFHQTLFRHDETLWNAVYRDIKGRVKELASEVMSSFDADRIAENAYYQWKMLLGGSHEARYGEGAIGLFFKPGIDSESVLLTARTYVPSSRGNDHLIKAREISQDAFVTALINDYRPNGEQELDIKILTYDPQSTDLFSVNHPFHITALVKIAGE